MIDGRRLMMASRGGGSGAQVVTGMFTGDQSSTVELNIGFKPDIIEIESDVDYYTTGWIGIGHAVIVKNNYAELLRHNNASTNGAITAVNAHLRGAYGEYGDVGVSGSAMPYGSYSDGIFTFKNTQNLASTQFINGKTYNWVAVKHTTD